MKNRRKLRILYLLVILALGLTACGKESVYEDNKSSYKEIISVDGVSFDMSEHMLSLTTAIINISEDTQISAADTYLYKNGSSEYLFFNMQEIVIAIEKGTSYGFSDATDKLQAISNDSVMGIWCESSKRKKLEYVESNEDGIYKAIAEVTGGVSITEEIYGDFSGRLAVIDDGNTEWTMFAGLRCEDYTKADSNRKEVIDHVIKSFRIYEKSESDNSEVVEVGTSISDETFEGKEESIESDSQVDLSEANSAYTSNIYEQLSVGDTGLCITSLLDYRQNQIILQEVITGDDAEKLIKKACNKTGEVYEEAPEGCTWHVAKYSLLIDPQESYVNIKLRGLDGERLCYRGIPYTKRTYDIFCYSTENSGQYDDLYCYYAVPNGCKEYTLECGEGTIDNAAEGVLSAYFHVELK